ncbi:MAG: hypothetical protein L3J87_04770 [Thermoplasmata archaeon]|nr:hypothetical protein [Thermoplasmata archaeon]
MVVGSEELESFWKREVRPASRALVLGGAGLLWVGYWGIALQNYTYSQPLTRAILNGESIALLLLGPVLLVIGLWLTVMRARRLEVSEGGIRVWSRRGRVRSVDWAGARLRVEVVDRREQEPAVPTSSAGVLRLHYRWYALSGPAVELALEQARRRGLTIRSRCRSRGGGQLKIHRITADG